MILDGHADPAEFYREELRKYLGETRIRDYYPETGPLSRQHYQKHMEHYAAGALHDERMIVGANRSGKSFCLAYEGACHVIGWYPPWWTGRRFDRPVVVWASGEDAKSVRESLQRHFMGPPEAIGTGLIPANLIERAPSKGGIPDAIDFAQIRHPKGTARLVFKAYEMGRESYQAAAVDVVLNDEEPPIAIYTESYTRTISTVPGQRNGIVVTAFTPLKGATELALSFLPGAAMPATEEIRKKAWGW